MSNSTSMARILLDAGADPNIGHESQVGAPLHDACGGLHIDSAMQSCRAQEGRGANVLASA